MEKIEMDPPEVAERLRQDPDSYQHKVFHTEMAEEIATTSQRADVKIGVMGHPELANPEFGREVLSEVRKNLIPALKKAIC